MGGSGFVVFRLWLLRCFRGEFSIWGDSRVVLGGFFVYVR